MSGGDPAWLFTRRDLIGNKDMIPKVLLLLLRFLPSSSNLIGLHTGFLWEVATKGGKEKSDLVSLSLFLSWVGLYCV